MNNDNEDLVKAITEFQDYVNDLVDTSLANYESIMRNEPALKRLLERIGEIPNIEGSQDEHKADT